MDNIFAFLTSFVLVAAIIVAINFVLESYRIEMVLEDLDEGLRNFHEMLDK